jgi:signal transduction histidine kinase
LTGIAFATEVLLQKLQSRSAAETNTAQKISEMIDDAITQARQLARGLQPVSLEATGLVAALRELAIKVEDVFRVRCLFEYGQLVFISDNTVATHLYRIAQEAINNAIQHGKARTIIIEIAEEPGSVSLTIRDDGIGLERAAQAKDGKGIGLQSMSYRARAIGGTFEMRAGPRGGTVVTCVVPLTATTKSEDPKKSPSSIALETASSDETVAMGKSRSVQRRVTPKNGSKRKPAKARHANPRDELG